MIGQSMGGFGDKIMRAEKAHTRLAAAEFPRP
jgi:hypothetical protein